MPLKGEAKQKYNKVYYKKNKEYHRKHSHEYYLANKEYIQSNVKKYFEQNKEMILEKRKKSYLEKYKLESEKFKERSRQWLKRNKDYSCFKRKLRECRKQMAIPLWADLNKIKIYYQNAKLLTEVTGEKYHVDHIIPLNGRNVCGLHWEGNLQILPASMNIRKSNKTIGGCQPQQYWID